VSCCLLLGAAAAPDAVGQTATAQSILVANPDSALVAEIDSLPGERLLLEDAVGLAAQAATTARIAEAGLTAAGNAVRREKGAFDPELFGGAEWSGADTPSASLFAGADVLETERADYEAGARILLPLGTELSASLQSFRITSNSAFAALSPEYQAGGTLSVRQPLLKGFGPSARSDLSFAEQNLTGAAARYENAVLAVRAEVETTYWQLYAAERNHAVTRLIRDRAAAFLEDTRLRARAGMIGPSQVANAEFFLTEAEQAVLDTEEQLDRLSDRLASLMGRRPGPDATRYRSWDEPPREFPTVARDTLVAVVMDRNPELQALAADVEAVRARERGATWDARPTLDLVGGLGGNGLAGSPRDVYFPGSDTPVRTSVSGDRGESVSQVFGRDYPTWNVGFVFAVPLGAREGGGERDRLRAEIVRAEQQLEEARRLTEESARAQHRELERGRERMEIATRGVQASIRQVEIGMLEYRNGRTTAFEVVRLAADLATAQQRYSDALVRTARAAAVLRQLTGGWYPETRNEEN
jgi:outer membrane protein TolC